MAAAKPASCFDLRNAPLRHQRRCAGCKFARSRITQEASRGRAWQRGWSLASLIELMSLHDQMLAEAGSRWDDFRPFNITALPEERIQFYRREIERLIIQEYNDEPWFVLKEPRICRFPALYLEVLPDLELKFLLS